MKIVKINARHNTDDVYRLINQKLNPFFYEQRQSDMVFTVKKVNNGVEISQPEHYEGYLFRIETNGEDLHIFRSENYVDDVNSLTVESILNSLYDDLAGDKGESIVMEG